MKRPLALTLVGTFWFLFGVVCVAGDVIKEHGLQMPDFNWMYLVVGIGLLQGWRLCRWLALWASATMFLFTVLFSFLVFNTRSGMTFDFPFGLSIDNLPQDTWSFLALVAILLFSLVASVWMLFVLLRDDVRAVFHKERRNLLRSKLG